MKGYRNRKEKRFSSLDLAPALGTFGMFFLWQLIREASRGKSPLVLTILTFVSLLSLFVVLLMNIVRQREELDRLRTRIEEPKETTKHKRYSGDSIPILK